MTNISIIIFKTQFFTYFYKIKLIYFNAIIIEN